MKQTKPNIDAVRKMAKRLATAARGRGEPLDMYYGLTEFYDFGHYLDAEGFCIFREIYQAVQTGAEHKRLRLIDRYSVQDMVVLLIDLWLAHPKSGWMRKEIDAAQLEADMACV